jgi:hypothetical protein
MIKRLMACLVLLSVFVLAPVVGPSAHTVQAFDSACVCHGSIAMYDDQWNNTGNPTNDTDTETSTWGACNGFCGDWVFGWAQAVCSTYSPETIVVNWWWWYFSGSVTPVGPQQYACSDIT